MAGEAVGVGQREGAHARAEGRAAAVADLRAGVKRGLFADHRAPHALVAVDSGNLLVEQAQLGRPARLLRRVGQAGVRVGLGDTGQLHRSLRRLGQRGVGDIAGRDDGLATIHDHA